MEPGWWRDPAHIRKCRLGEASLRARAERRELRRTLAVSGMASVVVFGALLWFCSAFASAVSASGRSRSTIPPQMEDSDRANTMTIKGSATEPDRPLVVLPSDPPTVKGIPITFSTVDAWTSRGGDRAMIGANAVWLIRTKGVNERMTCPFCGEPLNRDPQKMFSNEVEIELPAGHVVFSGCMKCLAGTLLRDTGSVTVAETWSGSR